VEIELRLGKISRGAFDTNVGKENFEKILRGLEKYQGWESVTESHETVYIKGDTRVIDDEKTGKSKCQKKTRVKKMDLSLKDQPFDVRLSVSTEVPVKTAPTEFEDMRVKKRKSFLRKNLSIDMTRVTGNPDDPDSEEDERYEVELEIVDTKELKDDVIVTNILQKVLDVLKLLA
jgi:hypothetical protein